MNNLVWHYTSLDVLEKVFLEKEPRMRATHFRNFADTDEIVRGATILLNEFKNDAHFRKTSYTRFLEALISDKQYRDDFYVLSFCTQRDHFCQWINYANKDGIGGCAIGFKQNQLANLFVHKIDADELGGDSYTPEFNGLIECSYVDESEIVQDRIKKITQAYNWDDLSDALKPFQESTTFAKMFYEVIRIKRKVFSFEQESRLLLRFREPRLPQYMNKNPYPYLSDDNKALYCPFDISKLKAAHIEIMWAPNADQRRGEEIVSKINRHLSLSIVTSRGKATGKKCLDCSRYATLLAKGYCNA